MAVNTGTSVVTSQRPMVAIAVGVVTVVALAHAKVVVAVIDGRAEVVATSVVVAAATVDVPGVTTAIAHVEAGASEVEEVAYSVAGIDAEVPATGVPVERTEEIGCGLEGFPLPRIEDIAQIEVTTLPVDAIDVVGTGDTHEVVEVDLVSCLILFVGQVEFIGHLIREEEGFVAGLLVAHGVSCG